MFLSNTIINPYTKDFREEKSGTQIYSDSPHFGTYSTTEISLLPIKTKGKSKILYSDSVSVKTSPNDPAYKRDFSPKILEGSITGVFGFKPRAEPTVYDLSARAHFDEQARREYDNLRYENLGFVPTLLDKKGVNLNQGLEEMKYIRETRDEKSIKETGKKIKPVFISLY